MLVLKIGAAALLTAGALLLPHPVTAQLSGLARVLEEPSRLLHSSTPGYLGVLVADVDSDFASKNRLKEVRGAAVTLIDHDAPAAQVGIRVNDVILQVNGQPIDNAEMFTRALRELPAGHTISLLISRDGNTQTIAVELCDHKKMEHDVWNKLDQGADSGQASPTMGILGNGGGDVPSSPGFHLPFFNSTLNVGAIVEPLAPQMADYLGVQSGLMIKQVTRKSEAEAAGLRAFDVILKVGNESIATSADWDRALRANQNKPVQVTILRDRRQQTVTLQVDSKRHRSELEDLLPESDSPLMAALDPEAAAQLAQQTFSVSPEQAEQFEKHLQQQAQRLQQELNDKNFKLDQQELDQLKQQMQQFRQNLKPEAFKFDQKLFDQLKHFQEIHPPDFDEQMREQMKRQMDQLKRQLEEMQAQGFDHMV
jgi:serine protease Do